MLRSTEEIIGYRVEAVDASFGKVAAFYFDDQTWTIRYLVLDTGKWLPGHLVLISPTEIGEADWMGAILPVSLTKKQVEESPSIRSDLPVSRQQEAELAKHYRWVPYWEPTALSMGGGVAAPVPAAPVNRQYEIRLYDYYGRPKYW